VKYFIGAAFVNLESYLFPKCLP